MKVEMDEKGTLTISAESTVESYALSQWYAMWMKRESVFLIQTVSRATDGSGSLDMHYQPIEDDWANSGKVT